MQSMDRSPHQVPEGEFVFVLPTAIVAVQVDSLLAEPIMSEEIVQVAEHS